MRIRQIALVCQDLEPIVEDLSAVFDLSVAFRDPGIATFGLHNALLPVGDTFLEVLSPQQEGTTAGRLLERRGGDGGYMVILQTEDLEAHRKRMAELGVRIVWETAFDDIATLHLHPRDVGGAILSLDAADPPSSWRWAGPDWASRPRSTRALAIAGVTIQAADPAAMARRWSEVVGHASVEAEAGRHEIPVDDGRIRFVPEADDRGEGVAAIELRVADPEAVRAAAEARGLLSDDGNLTLCGTRFELTG